MRIKNSGANGYEGKKKEGRIKLKIDHTPSAGSLGREV